MKTNRLFLLIGMLLASIACSRFSSKVENSSIQKFFPTDIRSQTSKFIEHYHMIELTPEQEKIKETALSTIPAPCCKEYSIATCCCPCNLAKAVWGLSNFLIAEQHYNAEQLHQAVTEWIESTNPKGYTGDACREGKCNHPFHQNGCGGMNEQI